MSIITAPKLIMSDDLPSSLEQYAQIYQDVRQAGYKQAAENIFNRPISELAPTDPNKVGIHIVALGDWERYGLNKNGDGFPEKPCREFHDTFVSHGALYQLHKNKDFNKRLGEIVASAYNPGAYRIEVFVHADRDKAAPYLHEIERKGTYPFSMAAFVPWDECTVCKHRRLFSAEGTVCEHVEHLLSHVLPDGTAVGTLNWLPTFHDISFVPRGADRIAYDLGLYMPGEKAASHFITSSLERARLAGLVLGGAESPRVQAKRRLIDKLAAAEAELRKPESSALIFNATANQLTDQDIEQFRHYQPRTMFKVAAEHGIVFSFPQFCQIVYGSQVPEEFDKIAAHGVYTVALGDTDHCLTESYFDVDPGPRNIYAHTTPITVDNVAQASKYAGDMSPDSLRRRAMSSTVTSKIMKDKLAEVSPEGRACACAYTAYTLGALFSQKLAEDSMVIHALAAQNLQHTRS